MYQEVSRLVGEHALTDAVKAHGQGLAALALEPLHNLHVLRGWSLQEGFLIMVVDFSLAKNTLRPCSQLKTL